MATGGVAGRAEDLVVVHLSDQRARPSVYGDDIDVAACAVVAGARMGVADRQILSTHQGAVVAT